MGLYAEIDLDGASLPRQGKADALIDSGAHLIRNFIEWDDSWINRLICVVENDWFDAAAICTDEEEFRRFMADTSGRPKYWLIVPDATLLTHVAYTPDPRD